jgi:hypothetical protein
MDCGHPGHTGVTGDFLCFLGIARAWSKVAQNDPDILVGALVSSFWRGEFEEADRSLLFALSAPNSLKAERAPGNYAIGGGTILKVGEDGRSRPTAERSEKPVHREMAAYHCQPDWGALPEEPPGFWYSWSDEKRDQYDPRWRQAFQQGCLALSTIPFDRWSPDMREHQFERWCIRRRSFLQWYKQSPLSAGVPLTKFWPIRKSQVEQMPAYKRKGNVGRKPFPPLLLAALKTELYRLLDEYGDPYSTSPHEEFNSKEKVYSALLLFATNKPKDFRKEPSRATLQKHVNVWLDEWRRERSARN